ncbi:hypothetical protein RD792_007250, partial [Penstemon davidsonii]
ANITKIFVASVCATFVLTSIAQLLPEDEVQALRRISSGLQNNYWNISRSSCVEATAFNRTFVAGEIYSSVVCNCSFNNNTVCHVTNIQMQRLNLTGTLPVEFASLGHLREIDFSLNYLNGSIPSIFGQLPLVILSLLGNRISGTIPVEIGNITTLEQLVLEDNLLEGNLPAELGSLSNLGRLVLSANNFNGTIPVTFGNLRNLTDFRIDGNRISGQIPDFIGNWTRLGRLHIQGTLMEGPIPDSISRLRNLTYLRISDLNGPSMSFPSLQDMRDMLELVLKNCSIIGPIPTYVGDMSNLTTLDLSFNMLNGQIPSSLQSLRRIDFLYITRAFLTCFACRFMAHNSLTGETPGWILDSRENM